MHPWKRNFDSQADIYATWVEEVVTSRPTFVFSGPDERIWLKGSDNGATMTYDGIHYSGMGEAECANQEKIVTGY